MSVVYLDHNATTPTDPRVVEEMLPYFSESYGNPSSAYGLAQETKKAMEDARGRAAAVLGCGAREIYFTSGGTESDNIALKGVAFAGIESRGHIVTTAIEHHAVLHTADYLRDRFGFEVTYLPVDGQGLVDPGDVAGALRDDTILVSVMMANNEVGTIEPLAEIAEVTREQGVPLHTDAVQAVGKVPIDLDSLGVDLLSLSGHKIYGPKGVGLLYVRKGFRLDPLTHGGSHERSMRAGTENVPGIVGLARALELASEGLGEESGRLSALTDRLYSGIAEAVPDVSLNGHPERRLPGTVNIAFHWVEGESVVLALDMEGIAVSTGSACTTDSAEPSHVLSAMGIPANLAQGSVRFGLGRSTTESDVDHVLGVLPDVISRLRAISPLYKNRA